MPGFHGRKMHQASEAASCNIPISVYDIGRVAELVTQLFLEILAHFIAKLACGAALCAVRLVTAKIAYLAVFTFHTPVVDAVRRIFIAFYRMGTNLARNGRCTSPNTGRNSFELILQTLLLSSR